MKINMAHLIGRAPSGGWINYAVFDARSDNGDNDALLHQLTVAARASGFQVDQSALAFESGGITQYYGDRNLVSNLSHSWVPQWTHTIDL
jgi:hypothetical protein